MYLYIVVYVNMAAYRKQGKRATKHPSEGNENKDLHDCCVKARTS